MHLISKLQHAVKVLGLTAILTRGAKGAPNASLMRRPVPASSPMLAPLQNFLPQLEKGRLHRGGKMSRKGRQEKKKAGKGKERMK